MLSPGLAIYTARRYHATDAGRGEIFDTLLETQVVIEAWRKQYNIIRPHSSLSNRPPAPEIHKPLQLANG
jgi:hypothetical protein